MLKPPPKTGDTALDSFLRGVYEKSQELEAKSIPEDGWSLTDLTAEVSGVIGDKRDLIDIVTQYDSIESYLALVKDQEELLKDALEKLDSIEVSADWFSQILEWWDQNYKIIQDAQESLTYKREADAAALEAKQYAAETEQDRVATDRNLEEAEKAASDAANYRQGALTYREGSKGHREASEAARDLSEAAQALSEQFRDSAKAHREAAATSESNAASSASAASTDANKAKGSATEAAGEVAKATEIRGQVEVIETALRALMEDTEAWQDVSFALESVDGRISTGMQQVKNDILGGVGPAFDTLLELAEALGENADAIGTLTNELAKKADKDHTHKSADITDAYYFTGGSMKDRVVKTYTDGHIFSASDPDRAEHLARKAYVDAEVAKKANVSHTHVISDTSGLQTALDGKAPSSHVHSISDVDGLEAQLAARAAEEHKHVSADITDASYQIGANAVAGRLVVANPSDGDIYRYGTAEPGNSAALVNKFYVDREVNKKANSSHTHSWSDITGDSPTDLGYNVVTADDTPGDFPAGFSYGMSNGVTRGWNEAIQEGVPEASASSFVMVETKRHKNYSGSTVQVVYSYNNEHRPVYIRNWNHSDSVWGPFRASTADGHTHSISEVTGLQEALDAAGSAEHKHPVTDITASGTRGSNTYLRGDGTWATPTNTTYSVPSQAEAEAGTATTGRAFSAQRVSQAIASKAAPKSHTHTSSEISDSINVAALNSDRANKLYRTGADGMAHSSSDPTTSNHLTRKSYVDARPATWIHEGGVFTPDPKAAEGDVVIDLSTGTVHKIINGGL